MGHDRTITTERLLLRPFEEGDFDILHRLYGDAEVMRYTPFDAESPVESAAHLSRVVDDWRKEPLLSREYVVTVRTEDGSSAGGIKKIGRCHILLDGPEEDSRAMIGWLLVQEAWGKGYATEIAAALLSYCFDTLKTRGVYGLCHPANTASRRVMEKCGMHLAVCRLEFVRYEKAGRVTMEDELEYRIFKPSKEGTGGKAPRKAAVLTVRDDLLTKKGALAEARRILADRYIEEMSEKALACELYFHARIAAYCRMRRRTPLLDLFRVREKTDPIDLRDGGDTLLRRAFYRLFWMLPSK